MFGLLRDQSRSAAGAIWYVTIGTLLVIWASLWYYYFLMPSPNPPAWQRFACVGTILSGFAIGAIGMLFGLIGRSSKGADTTVGVAAAEPIAAVATPDVSPTVVVSTPSMSASSGAGVPVIPHRVDAAAR
ncbi:MAG: hypothetical protein SH850_01020 [Planctomycetaceae bacterium]|nr:hypothetical protein [Planctomycetaceae bacterium]